MGPQPRASLAGTNDQGPPCLVTGSGALSGLEVAQGALACITLLCPLQGPVEPPPSLAVLLPRAAEGTGWGGAVGCPAPEVSFAAPGAEQEGAELLSPRPSPPSASPPGSGPAWGDWEEGGSALVSLSSSLLEGSELGQS